MDALPVKSRIAAVVLLTGAAPTLISVAARLVFGDTAYVHAPMHESLEVIGTSIALGVAMLLLLRARNEPGAAHLLWVAAALVGMGLADGLHGTTSFGVAWSWLRHGATLVGGLLFAMVWRPPPAWAVGHERRFLLTVGALVFGAAAAVWLGSETLPPPWRPQGYTWLVKGTNVVGGLGFLAAAAFFLRRYARAPATDDLVFAGHTLLFGAASLCFGFSKVWAADWWVWHAARLVAYAIVLVAAYDKVVELYSQIARHARELGGRVEARTAELRTSEERYHALYSAMEEGLALHELVHDGAGRATDYRLLDVNPAFERITGISRERAVGTLASALYGSDEPPFLDVYARVVASRRSESFEVHFAPMDKSFHISAFTPSEGRFATVFQDITERKRVEEALRDGERNLKASLAEKEVLLKEVHHRVKNNMQVISSIVSLQAEALPDPALRGVFGEVRDRVRSMALVHEKLYQTQSLARIDAAEYARSLLQQLWRAHGAGVCPRLTLALRPATVNVDQAVPLGLILNELAVNALKHGFAGRAAGEVTVILERDDPSGAVHLVVRDDGNGLPEGFDCDQARTLGLRLVRMLVRQLNGSLTAGGAVGGGARFEVVFVPDAA